MKTTKQRTQQVLSFLAASALILGYQNCGGFSALSLQDSNSAASCSTPGCAIPDAPAGASEAPQPLTCDPKLRGTSEFGARRLTKREIIASLTSLFGGSVMGDATIVASLQQIPEQSTVTNAAYDNRIIDVAGLEAVASSITDLVFKDPALVNTVLGGCDLTNLAGCTDSLVNNFALKAFRRPAPVSTAQSIRDLVTQVGGIDGLKSGIVRVVLSPFFSQIIELGENGDCEGTTCPTIDSNAPLKLTQYEVASRLAFQITGAPPDKTLLDAAAAGQLSTVASVKAQAQRLAGTQQARDNWKRVITDWLGIRSVSDPNAVVGAELGIAAAGFGQETFQDLLQYSEYEIFDRKNSVYGLFTDNKVIANTQRLATAYGVPMSSDPQPVSNGMGGLILRPAVLMTANSVTSPILRGVFVQRKILCNQLPSPDASIVASRLADLDSVSHIDYSNRDLVAKVTSPTTCFGCHSMINPVGFSLEGFGPFGTPRKIEKIYDMNGPTSIQHPIVTHVDDLVLGAKATPADDGAGMVQAVAKGSASKACFDAALIVNTRYRKVDDSDSCLMNELASLQMANRSIVDLIVQSTANEGIFWKTAKGLQ